MEKALKRYTVHKKNGEVMGVFCFNPLDVNMPARFEALNKKIAGITEPLREIGLKLNGTTETVADTAVLQSVEEQFKDSFEYVYGIGTYKAFFSEVRPFASVHGKFYCEQVLTAINRVIEEELNNFKKKYAKNFQR